MGQGSFNVASLHYDCQHGYDKCASLLLLHGVVPNIPDKNKETPLYLACLNGHDKCVSLLSQYKANPNIACLKGNHTCVSLLSQHGADPNIANNNNFTPYM